MIQKIKKNILNNKQNYIIGSILFLSFVCMLWYSFNDVSVWWDQAIYIGMGKYIASSGHIGFWEIFRPPLLPLIYSLLFILNIPLIFSGKIIVIFSSIGIIWIIYLFSESIRKGSGVFSSIFLLFTPIFFYYSKIATTDIISVFFVMLSILLYSRRRYFLVGVFIALSFLLRFPQGLMLLSVGIIIVYETYNKNYFIWFKDIFNKGLFVLTGFIIITTPYFVSNYLLYGDILKPLTLGIDVVNWSNFSYDFGTWYYAKELLLVAPFLYLSFFTIFIFYKKEFFIDLESRKKLIYIFITVVVFMGYFFWQPHKELRYSLAFIPYLAILSGVSLSFIFKNTKKKIIIIIVSIFITSLICIAIPSLKNNNSDAYIPLNAYLKKLDGSYISTTPIPAAFGKIRVLSLFESASGFKDAFIGQSEKLDGVFIKDCDIFCAEKNETRLCYNDLMSINDIITKSEFKKTYEVVIDKCVFDVYKK